MPQVPPGAQLAAVLLLPVDRWPVTAKVASFFCVSVLLQAGQTTAWVAWLDVRINCSKCVPQVIQTKSNKGMLTSAFYYTQLTLLIDILVPLLRGGMQFGRSASINKPTTGLPGHEPMYRRRVWANYHRVRRAPTKSQSRQRDDVAAQHE